MKPLNQFPILQTFSELVEPLWRHCDQNLTKNEHVCAIYCRPEVAGDVVSGENVQITECYAVLHFEAASISSFR